MAASTTAASAAARAAASSSSALAKSFFTSSEMKWAVGGWTFFVAENALLSENRTWLIQELGDGNYHAIYGTLSTAATASIAYSYYKLKKGAVSPPSTSPAALPIKSLVASWTTLTVGLIMASQALPKMQIPVSSKFEVRCPFDFSDRKHGDDGDDTSNASPRGLERITRHPGLWSLAFVGMGNACLQSSLPLKAWWMGPTMVAWLGGSHTDSRFRRNMGGHLNPSYDSQTSNLPFGATLTGKQGSPTQAMSDLVNEIKPLNAGVAALVATAFVASRGRVMLRMR